MVWQVLVLKQTEWGHEPHWSVPYRSVETRCYVKHLPDIEHELSLLSDNIHTKDCYQDLALLSNRKKIILKFGLLKLVTFTYCDFYPLHYTETQ